MLLEKGWGERVKAVTVTWETGAMSQQETVDTWITRWWGEKGMERRVGCGSRKC